ncbi:MAG: hypothetical protein A3D33_12195 [Candidatus Rokubacteria bacterium RIFCSPHIGHO2_02_FULL_73_26]|nr:MAG: hypothetical protein A3D33_12195 [Candidatus Rokubacteria bacterium RIFCSPHIGHO2_02_FULL_73_26]
MSGRGDATTPAASRSWLTTPFRPRIAIQAYVRIRMLVRKGRTTATRRTLRTGPRVRARTYAVGTPRSTHTTVTPSAVRNVRPSTVMYSGLRTIAA